MYSNWGIVEVLKVFKGRINVESCEVKSNEVLKMWMGKVYEVKCVIGIGYVGYEVYCLFRIGKDKILVFYGIKIFKGLFYIVGLREFCRFVVYGEFVKVLLEWLNDIRCVDELFFVLFYWYLGILGGVLDGW